MASEKLKDAVSYSLNHREELCRFLEDGRVPCDNGFCERSIRILSRGRRAWLFANTPRGADAMMYAYSMVETAIPQISSGEGSRVHGSPIDEPPAGGINALVGYLPKL